MERMNNIKKVIQLLRTEVSDININDNICFDGISEKYSVEELFRFLLFDNNAKDEIWDKHTSKN